jgi:predicted nucleic acid-binding protein
LGALKNVVARASEFTRNGVKSKDALHVACAIEGKAEYFLTTDDKLLKKMDRTKELIVINPVNFIPILESM